MSSEHMSLTVIHPEKPCIFDSYLCDLSLCNQCHVPSLILDPFFGVTAPLTIDKAASTYIFYPITILQTKISLSALKDNGCFDHEPLGQGSHVALLPLITFATKSSLHDNHAFKPPIHSINLQVTHPRRIFFLVVRPHAPSSSPFTSHIIPSNHVDTYWYQHKILIQQ